MEQQNVNNPTSPDPAAGAGNTGYTAAEYRASIQSLLRNKKMRDAYELVQAAVVRFNDPFLLSSFGFLQAKVEGKYRNGIDACARAVSIYERVALSGGVDEGRSAELYLNLSKAYTVAGRRKNAVEALTTGLKRNKNNKQLQAELDRLGVRKLIPIPFLNRSNFLNEMIGRLLRKKKPTDADGV